MRKLILIASLFSGTCLYAQSYTVIKYFDAYLLPVSSEKWAFFRSEFIKENNQYKCTSYWVKSGKVNCVSYWADTSFKKPTGLLRRYYENGNMEDSTYMYEDGKVKNTYHYYSNGKLWAHYAVDETGKEISEGYDENGNKIKDFIYGREAEYPGGTQVWTLFIQRSMSKIKHPKKTPPGMYKVIIRFIIDTDGSVTDISPETFVGYGMEEACIKELEKSPKWIPAVKLNKPVKAYRRQPFTFVVEAE